MAARASEKMVTRSGVVLLCEAVALISVVARKSRIA